MIRAKASTPVTIEDEARTLGADPRSVLLHVRIPLLARPLSAAALLAFLVGWSDYIVTLLVGGGQVVSVPLKAPVRIGWLVLGFPIDAALAAELRASAKAQAENLMIVDLLRNDIARISEVGSVKVPDLYRMETYSTVHQMTSTIVGQLRGQLVRAAVHGRRVSLRLA